MKRKLFFLFAISLCFNFSFSQNIAVNTAGSAAASTNMFEVTQTNVAANMIAIYAIHQGTGNGSTGLASNHSGAMGAGNSGYALQAVKSGNGLGTNVAGYFSSTNTLGSAYSIIIPPSGGNMGIGTSAPSELLHVDAGSEFINGEGQGLIVDASGNKRVGLMKYVGYEAMYIGQNVTASGISIRLGRWSGGTIQNPTTKYNDLIIDNSGNIGINNTSPNWLVDAIKNQNAYTLYAIRNNSNGGGALSGMICYNDNAASAGIFGLTSSGWNLAGPYPILGQNKVIIDANTSMNGIVLNNEGAQPIIFGTSMTEKMRVDGNGNVGIGTTSPSDLLHLSAVSNTNIRLTHSDATSAVNSIGFYEGATLYGFINQRGTTHAEAGQFNIGNNTAATAICAGPGGQERINILATGNVGIATTNPVSLLQVNKSITHSYPTPGTTTGSLHISPSSGTNDDAASITFGANNNATTYINQGQAGIYVQSSGAYGTKMYFGTTNSYATGSQIRMMIDHAGNVGIDQTVPTERLHLDAGSVYLNGEGQGVIVDASSLKRVGFMKYSGYEGMLIGDATLTNPIRLGRFTGGTIKSPTTITVDLTVNGSGNVGIGANNTSPAATLDVAGTMKVFGARTALSANTVYGPATTDGFLCAYGREDCASGTATMDIKADGSNPPTTVLGTGYSNNNGVTYLGAFQLCVPIRKGEYYEAVFTPPAGGCLGVGNIYFVPLGH